MRINKIRFQNLNSLTGTWCIDFSKPPYTESSLFAITGATGAGKSTLLDCICLALYGRTPRLERITKTTNEIMSRHTGSCFAEVEFETMQGTFRCHWSQHRSRKKASGELQQPRHEIANAATGAILENRMRNVLTTVESVTGMDFNRFTRSTLLAQGGFAAFLKAKPDERSPLLEQITGSKIYSQISMQVHDMYSVEKRRCEELEQDLVHIAVLPDDQEEELKQVLQQAVKTHKGLKTALTTLQSKQLWLRNIESLQGEIHNHTSQLNELKTETRKQKKSLDKLPLALAAKELEPLFLELQNLQNSLQACYSTSASIEKNLAQLTPALAVMAQKKEGSKVLVKNAEEKRKAGLALIKDVQELDHTIQAEKKRYEVQRNDLASEKDEAAQAQNRINSIKKELQTGRECIKKLEQFFKKRAGEEKLVTEYSLIEGKIKRLLELRKRRRDASRKPTSDQENNEVTRFTKKLTAIETETAEVHKELEFLQSKLQLLIRIQSLEEERKKLISNQPCPLCGSTSHPYRTKELPEISKEERLDHLLEIQEMLHVRAAEWKKNKDEQKHLTPLVLTGQSTLKHAEEQSQSLQAKIQKKITTLSAMEGELKALQKKRHTLFAEKSTTEEAKTLEKGVNTARDFFEKLHQEYLGQEKKITVGKARQSQLQDEQKRHRQEIKSREQIFSKALADSSFNSKEEFLKAKLPPPELESLTRISNSLQKRRMELHGLLTDKKIRLNQEQAKQLTRKNLQTLKTEFSNLEHELDKQHEIIISTKTQLEHNRTEKLKVHKKLKKLALQKQVLHRWGRLHMLIGSADGKKFRNFAQGLTFEMMVNQANVHLAKMNNRYILIRDTTQPLELNVMDTYQAGEIRSTKNLSGGESFLISLALALGLSHMASDTIRVDSLFLDEGFGTLDEDSLESALDILSELQEENKLIGVISHVAALKERIPLQIEILTDSNGKSRIKGTGISREL